LVTIGLSDPPIEARLVGCDGEFPVDSRDILLVGDHQPGQIFGEMASLGLIGEE